MERPNLQKEALGRLRHAHPVVTPAAYGLRACEASVVFTDEELTVRNAALYDLWESRNGISTSDQVPMID